MSRKRKGKGKIEALAHEVQVVLQRRRSNYLRNPEHPSEGTASFFYSCNGAITGSERNAGPTPTIPCMREALDNMERRWEGEAGGGGRRGTRRKERPEEERSKEGKAREPKK